MFLRGGWPLLAAAFTATSLLHLSFSQQARPHGVATGLMLIAVLASVAVARKPSLPRYLASGVAVALALGCLQSGVATLIPLAVAHVWASRGRGWPHQWRSLVPLGVVMSSLLVFYPFLLFGNASMSGQMQLERSTLKQAGHSLHLDRFNGQGFGLIVRTFVSYEPAIAALAVVALLALAAVFLRRSPVRFLAPQESSSARDLTVILSFVLPYLLIVGLYENSYERFVLPLLPYAAVMAAAGVAFMARALPVPLQRSGSLGLAFASLALPLCSAVRLELLRLQPDTYEQAARWIDDHIDRNDRLYASYGVDVPLAQDPASLAANRRFLLAKPSFPWLRHQIAQPPDAIHAPRRWYRWIAANPGESLSARERRPHELLRQLGVQYLIIDANESRHPETRLLRHFLLRTATRLARFSPDGDEDATNVALNYQDQLGVVMPNFTARIWTAKSLGAVLEIYRVAGGGN